MEPAELFADLSLNNNYAVSFRNRNCKLGISTDTRKGKSRATAYSLALTQSNCKVDGRR